MLTANDILEFVQNEFRREGVEPNSTHVLALANQGLRLVAEVTQCYVKEFTTWTGHTSGIRYVSLPSDLIRVLSAKWEDVALTEADRQSMDTYRPGWAADTTVSTPVYFWTEGQLLQLDPIPNKAATNNLKIVGVAYPGDLAQNQLEANNPLQYLPDGHQLLPAYYALANIMPNPEGLDIGMLRMKKYGELFDNAVRRAGFSVKTRNMQRFGF